MQESPNEDGGADAVAVQDCLIAADEANRIQTPLRQPIKALVFCETRLLLKDILWQRRLSLKIRFEESFKIAQQA